MMYNAPVQEMLFLFEKVLSGERVFTGKFKNFDKSMAAEILAEAAKIGENVLAPINKLTDMNPPIFRDGEVKCGGKLKDAYSALSSGGWIGVSGGTQHGGMGLPSVLTTCINEIFSSGCMALSLNALMTQGQIDALESHASDNIKKIFLPKLNTGQWSGTMNLTEPQAGSDVGALTTKAEESIDGTYKVSGQKIYISWGDHDLCENICHLVLARIPGSPKGSKGISLFLVPKFLPNKKGEPSERNNVKSLSMEKKLGLHGSPTMVLEYNRATGWLIGNENQGLTAMFTMMNNARLGVGVEGLSQSERAYQHALAFAKDRIQGKKFGESMPAQILDHADVRRTLLEMKAMTAVCRAICMDCSINIDLSKLLGQDEFQKKADVLTPIAKAFSTDVANKVTEQGIQVHGGMGFIEETGVAQFYRDARVTSIYEGTNGIQAMDLVGRKLQDGGQGMQLLLKEIKKTEIIAVQNSIEETKLLTEARIKLSESIEWMLGAQNINERYAGSLPFLKAFGFVLGGHYLLKSALMSDQKEKHILAKYYLKQILPMTSPMLEASTQGAAILYSYDFAVDALP